MTKFVAVEESAKVPEIQKAKEGANATTIIRENFVMNAKIMIFISKRKHQRRNNHIAFGVILHAR